MRRWFSKLCFQKSNLCRYAEVLPPSSREAVRSSAGEGTGWEPSGAQNLDEGRLGEGVDGDTDGTGVGVDGRGMLGWAYK